MTQQEGGHLQVKEWPQRKANLLTPFGFQPPKQREDVSGIQASQCTALCYGGLSRLRTGSIGLGPTLIHCDLLGPHLNMTASAETLFLNEVTFIGSRS